MQPLQYAAGVVEPAVLGAAAGLGSRWFVGVAVCFAAFCSCEVRRHHSEATVHRALSGCVWPVLGMPWATVRSNAAYAVCRRCGGVCTWCCYCAGQVVWGGAFLQITVVLQLRWRCSPTTAHRALPVCEWPALGMLWATVRSNAASAVPCRFG